MPTVAERLRAARPFPYSGRTAADAMALLWFVGGLTTITIVLLPHPAQMWDEVMVAVGISSPIVALAVHLLRDRLPRTACSWLLAAGTAVVTLLVIAGGGGSASVSLSYFYLWVAVYALVFLHPLIAGLHLVTAAFAYGAVLASRGSFAAGDLTAVEPTVLVAVVGTTGAVVLLLSKARETSELDPLTGVANRRGLDRVLEAAMERAAKLAEPLVVAVLDVDHFKQVNDRGGHQAGDQLLTDSVASWAVHLRHGDTLARFGGDEFVVVLPGCSVAGATGILERLRSGASDGVTCSVGLAEHRPGDSVSLLITRADAALYEAKNLGRNRMVSAGPHRRDPSQTALT